MISNIYFKAMDDIHVNNAMEVDLIYFIWSFLVFAWIKMITQPVFR